MKTIIQKITTLFLLAGFLLSFPHLQFTLHRCEMMHTSVIVPGNDNYSCCPVAVAEPVDDCCKASEKPVLQTEDCCQNSTINTSLTTDYKLPEASKIEIPSLSDLFYILPFEAQLSFQQILPFHSFDLLSKSRIFLKIIILRL